MKVAVITVSDRAYNGIYQDKSGEKIIEILRSKIDNLQIAKTIVPDEKDKILEA